jgi:hypothetical protein
MVCCATPLCGSELTAGDSFPETRKRIGGVARPSKRRRGSSAWQIYFRALLNSSRNPSSASIAARRRSSGGIVRSCDLVGRPGKVTRSCNARISRSRIAGVIHR